MNRKNGARVAITTGFAVAISIAVVLIVSGCSLIYTPAITTALEKFVGHLNGDRDKAYTDVDPAADLYAQIRDGTYLDSYFPDTGSYSISVDDVTDPANVSATFKGPKPDFSTDGTLTAKIVMKQVDGTWLINRLSLQDLGTVIHKLK